MGFFDKVKELAIKAKCATGFHAGTFVRVSGAPECHYEKVCPDCYEHLEQKQHSYGDSVYLNHGSCMKTSLCVHCDAIKEKVVHEAYRNLGVDDYCNVKEECVRCHDVKVKKKEHLWSEDRRDEHSIHESCRRCHEKRSRSKTSFR